MAFLRDGADHKIKHQNNCTKQLTFHWLADMLAVILDLFTACTTAHLGDVCLFDGVVSGMLLLFITRWLIASTMEQVEGLQRVKQHIIACPQ